MIHVSIPRCCWYPPKQREQECVAKLRRIYLQGCNIYTHTHHQVDTLTWASKIPRGGFLFCLKRKVYTTVYSRKQLPSQYELIWQLRFDTVGLRMSTPSAPHKEKMEMLGSNRKLLDFVNTVATYTWSFEVFKKTTPSGCFPWDWIIDDCPELDGCPSNVPVCRCRKEVRDRLLLGQKKSFKLWNIFNFNINIIYISYMWQ